MTIPSNNPTLTVSYIGLKAIDVQAKDGMVIELSTETSELDEVMVVAFGTTTKKSFTGAAGVVKQEDIEKRQTSNISNAIAGNVAGVQGFSSNGQPGSGSSIRIRGVGSMSAGNAPLYVVDGIPFDGDISSINNNDVENITVLKDAASAALYGARGANGVIMITTRRGKSKDAVVNVDAKWGTNQRGVPSYNVMTDPGMYYETFYQGLYNSRYYGNNTSALLSGTSAADAHAYASGALTSASGLGYNVYTLPAGEGLIGANGKLNPNAVLGSTYGDYYLQPDNWYNEIFNSQNLRQEYNVNISGSTDQVNYYFSAGYLDDSGIIANSGLRRFSTRARADYQVKEWLKVGANMSYVNSAVNYPSEQTTTNSSMNVFFLSNIIAPIYPLYVRNADGSIKQDSRGMNIYDFGNGRQLPDHSRPFMPGSNPAAMLQLNKEDFVDDYFSGKWYAAAELYDGLKLTANIGTNLSSSRYSYTQSKFYGQYEDMGGIAGVEQTRFFSLNQQYLLTYAKRFGVHNVDALVGYDAYNLTVQNVGGSKQNIYDPNMGEISNGINEPSAYSSTATYATMGLIAQAKYDYDTKYYVSASYRRDASSRFAPENRWGNFWSVGAAWDMKRENFMSDVDKLDMLKLKFSYGVQGNDSFNNNYPYLDQFSLTNNQGEFSTVLAYKGNRDITWETSHSMNVGVDFAAFNDRFSGNVDGFMRTTTDMLYNRPVAPSNGYTSLPVNVGTMRNAGLEVDLNGDVVKTRNVTWSIYANATYLKNEIVELAPELEGSWETSTRIYKEGGSLYNYYLRSYAGVDKTTGMALYYVDTNDNGKVDKGTDETTFDYSAADQFETGCIMPKVYGGFGTKLDAYGFDFSVSFAYQLGGHIYDDSYAQLMQAGKDKGQNFHADVLNAWTPTNTQTDVPRLNSADQYANSMSDRFLISSNFLSLQNVTLGYTLPTKWLEKAKIKSVRIYGVADNLALISARQGLDPRQGYTEASGSVYSPLRTISGGVKISF